MKRLLRLTRLNHLCVWLFLSPVAAFGQTQSEFASTSIRDILRFLEKSHQDITTFNQTKKLLTIQYDTLVYDIDRIKQSGNIGFFDRIELKNLLKESEDIAKQVVKIDNLIRAHEEANGLQVAKLVEMMDKEIADSMAVLLTKNRSISEESAAKVNRMFIEKAPFQFYRMKKFAMPLVEIKTHRSDDAEVLYQKADYIMDEVDRLHAYSSELDRMISFLRGENSLKKSAMRVTKFLGAVWNDAPGFMSYFPDSLVAFQRLPLCKNLIMPLDNYEILIERLTVEKEAAESRIRLYLDDSDAIRDIADYKNKVWIK